MSCIEPKANIAMEPRFPEKTPVDRRNGKNVKSNAIVYAYADRTVGIGAGQMSRVDSAKIAVEKAQTAGFSLSGGVAASDAFFPFPDGVEKLAAAGARAVIAPGGSIRDEEVAAAAMQTLGSLDAELIGDAELLFDAATVVVANERWGGRDQHLEGGPVPGECAPPGIGTAPQTARALPA